MNRNVSATRFKSRPSVCATSPLILVSLNHLPALEQAVIEGNWRSERRASCVSESPVSEPFEERHHPISYWSRRWGFSPKTVRDWFRDEYGSGILRQPNTGRRSKRDYTTIMVSASAAARVYAKRTNKELMH
jgi:hypothetical protein